MMFPLVLILIECICVKIRTWGWLAGFKSHHPGESDTLAMSASQGGSPSKKASSELGMDPGKGYMQDRTLLPAAG